MSKDRKLNLIFIKAAEGKRIKDPITFQLLAPEGEYKPHSTFWARRLMEQDVIECAPALEQAELPLEQADSKKSKKGKE